MGISQGGELDHREGEWGSKSSKCIHQETEEEDIQTRGNSKM